MSTNAHGCSRAGAENGLRDLRLAINKSQEFVARRANCSTGYYRLLESGFDPGQSDVLPRVLEVLAEHHLKEPEVAA